MKKTFTLLVFTLILGWNSGIMAQAFTFASGQLTYTENFDGMGPTGTTFISGWSAIRYAGTGTLGEVLTLVVTDGSSNSGAIYNVGTTDANDRSFGSLASGSTVPQFGAYFMNNTGSSITGIELSGTMEQWRSGSSNTANEVCVFEYSLDASGFSTGSWAAASGFDLVEKITTSTTAAALDGNLAENQTAISVVISGINWTPGSTLWIRWSDTNDGGNDGICSIDNMVMTVTTGTVTTDPEPTNYPTSFVATSASTSITTSWTDATGTQLPAGYLVKISDNPNITAPVDGSFEPDDIDFSDGNGAKNVLFGQESYTFNGLVAGTAYTLKIYPYTNGGTLADYKTDGSVPTSTATTQSIVASNNFNTDLAPWTQYSVTGTQVWTMDLTHGLNGTGCAKMSGFEGGTSFENEDWLISPAIDLSGITDTKLQFYTAYNYDGAPLAVLVSTDFSGGDPTTGCTWTDISSGAVFSAGGWAWTPSGFIALGVSDMPNVHIAFKYASTADASRTWEVDEVVVAGTTGVGIKENKVAGYTTAVYPNPCNDWFEAKTTVKSKYVVMIHNTQGSLVKTIETDEYSTKIETATLPTGLYFVTFQNTNNGSKEVHKLVVR